MHTLTHDMWGMIFAYLSTTSVVARLGAVAQRGARGARRARCEVECCAALRAYEREGGREGESCARAMASAEEISWCILNLRHKHIGAEGAAAIAVQSVLVSLRTTHVVLRDATLAVGLPLSAETPRSPS